MEPGPDFDPRRTGSVPVRRVLGVSALAAAAGWIGYSTFMVPHRLPLGPAVDGERREIARSAGRLS